MKKLGSILGIVVVAERLTEDGEIWSHEKSYNTHKRMSMFEKKITLF